MTGSSKNTPKAKGTAKAEDTQAGGRDDAAEGQQVTERDDIGAADGPGEPKVVKVITEVRPGLAN